MSASRAGLPPRIDLALVGGDPEFAEPGCGASVDAASSILRLGAVPDSALRERLGSRAGELAHEPLAELLARLDGDRPQGSAAAPPPRVFACGFDPEPFRAELARGVERGALALSGAMHRALGTPVPNHGLPGEYRCNPVAYFDDTGHTDEWQREVYELARELADARGFRRIVDLGCGSGYKLVHWFPQPAFRTLGIDLPDTVKFLGEKYPERQWLALDVERHDMLSVCADLIIASDVIEHLADPDVLLAFLARCRAHAIVLSTPDAQTLITRGQRDTGGPPRNPHHVREWNQPEFARYVSGSLELLHQELHLPNATQIAVCRPAGRPPQERPRAQGTRSGVRAARIRVPAERPYRGRSRTRELEHQLRELASERVAIELGEWELELTGEAGGSELTLFAAGGAREWNPLDGLLGAHCSRRALLAALAGERGPHGPERALLRLAGDAQRPHVQRSGAPPSPAAFLAQLDALLELHARGARWPDPRPVLGPAVRAAIAQAQAEQPALAEDLEGLWAVHTGTPRPRRPDASARKANPSAPELTVPIDPGAPWLLVDPARAGALDAAIAHAGSTSKSPLHLVLPWAAGLDIASFAQRLIEALASAGLERAAIAPLVVLERPLFAAEIAWVAENFSLWNP